MTDNANPYQGPEDQDADLWGAAKSEGTPKSRHTFSSDEVCPDCGNVHGNELPPEVEALVDKMLEEMPPEVRRSIAGVAFQMMGSGPAHPLLGLVNSFGDFLSEVDQMNPNGALLRAVLEVLDSMSGGEVQRRAEVYIAEQRVIANHRVLKSLNSYSDGIYTDKDADPARVQVCTYLMRFITERGHFLAQIYADMADRYDMPVDQRVLEEGLPTGDDTWAHKTLVMALESAIQLKK